MNLTAIDARPPTLEDPAALRTVLGRYAFVTIEKDFILFRKKSGAWPESSSERSKVTQRTISFGEEAELDEPGDGLQTISLKINDTWKGKVRSTLWQPKQLDLCVTSQSGAKQHCRLVPAMAEAGFVINPLLRDNHDLLTYLHRRGSERVRSIRVTAGLHPEAYYQPTIAMTLSEVPFLSFADANLASRTVDVSPVSAIVPCRPEAQGDSGMKLLPLARTQLDHAEFVHGVQVTVELDDASKKLSNLRVSWKTRADPLFAKDQSQTRLLPIAAGQAKVHVWIYDRFDSLLFETDHPAGLLRIQEVRLLAQHADRSRAAAAGQVYRAAPAACPDCDSARSR